MQTSDTERSSGMLLGRKEVTKKVRVAFYIRVSTQEQHDQGYSPEFQLEQLHEHVKRKDYKGWFTKSEWLFQDVGSGGDTKERKELNRMMELVKAKKIDLVLVWKIDRLSRKLSDLLELFEEMDEHKVGFASVKEDLDFTGAIGKLIFQIFGALAEFERENIRMRTEEGKLASAKAGNYTGGAIPYGYEALPNPVKGKKLKIVPREAEIVREIFENFTYHERSVAWIAADLNKRAIPKGRANKRTPGTRWRDYTISSMLANETYRGIHYANRWMLVSHKPERYEERPVKEWISTPVPAIVDDVLFYMAQERLQKADGRKKGGGGQEDYMLRGKLVEMRTGRGFVGYRSQIGTKNYRRKQIVKNGEIVEPSISIAAKQLEEWVWRHIKMAIDKPEDFLRLHKEMSKDPAGRDRLIDDLHRHEKTIAEANRRLGRIEEAYVAGEMDMAKYKARKLEEEQRRDAAFTQKHKAEERIIDLGKYEVGCKQLEEFSRKFKDGLEDLSYKQQQGLADMLVERVEIIENETERRARVVFRFDPSAISDAIPRGRSGSAPKQAKDSLLVDHKDGKWWVRWGSNPRPIG